MVTANSILNATHPIQQITVFLNIRGPPSVVRLIRPPSHC